MDGSYRGAEQHFDDAMSTLRNNPKKFVKVILFYFGCIFLIGLILATPSLVISWAKGDSGVRHAAYTATASVYSNIIPLESDVINLDHVGTLTPSPNNFVYTSASPNICQPIGKEMPYSEGIVMALNVSAVFKHIPQSCGISIEQPSGGTKYFSFKPGVTYEVTSSGRTFRVSLSRMKDLSTDKNGEYYEYVFDISEE